MTAPAVFWPAFLGLSFLVAGILSYRRDAVSVRPRVVFGLAAFGPAFVAASLAAFAGEHFTVAAALARLVPKWMPGRLFIAYFVGAAHLAAALSFVARRYVRWSALMLAVMFALFVLLMDLPGAFASPVRINWILAARETTFAVGALALFALAAKTTHPQASEGLATIARLWAACVLVFYGIQHILYPQFSPGVPSTALTASWVPLPSLMAYGVGALLVVFGVAMFVANQAPRAAVWCGLLMTVLTAALYVPQFFLAHTVSDQVTAVNFIFDTLLFAGMMLVIGRVLAENRWNVGEGEAVPFL